ncbi:hypothetical protein AG0111_0g2459 [Alternaria gaisen]|uniref:Uncharacterized protein n=1 Tax=Alternaria gaisen TaxID=167740 RepID=A0ACB6G583_9PLEO|nr:hypothetical protein AG0111_0g2459 [Alternaria gaisen]
MCPPYLIRFFVAMTVLFHHIIQDEETHDQHYFFIARQREM